MVKISEDFDYTSGKLNMLVFAQQHGNEPSGKEGALLFVSQFVEGKNMELLKHVNFFIIPQVNPDGGDNFERRNAAGIDLNRDHLLLQAPESQAIQEVFRKYMPEVSVDIHEYYPYSDSWKEFGYRKDFDIQLGGLTNINIDEEIYDLFKKETYPFVKQVVESQGYSFFEYTLGDLPDGERLRHSTVDVNDGRQSIGITNTLSFIIEGLRGEEKMDSIKRRAESQYYTILGLAKYAAMHATILKTKVNVARQKLIQGNANDSVAIRLDHFQGDEPLYYPLLSYETGKDSVFFIEKYYSVVKPTLNVHKPKGYLVPQNDSLLVGWLKRSGFYYEENFQLDGALMQYKLGEISTTNDEGIENKWVDVQKLKRENSTDVLKYYYVSVNQVYAYKIITALEPQSMYGLVYYPEFEYLLDNDYFPILRVE